MRATRALLFAAALLAAPALAAEPGDRGAQIYRTGAGVSARVLGNARLPGAMAACVLCHRPSGYGIAEGEALASAIAAPELFAPLAPRRDRLLRELYQDRLGPAALAVAHTPRSRPAYDGEADLARALREGVDPAGRALSPAMPRYEIGDADVAALTAYLRTLGADPDPGVDATTVTLATIIGPGVAPGRARAMLDVMAAFVARHNREITREQARPGFSPLYKAEFAAARRLWRLDVWRLEGAREGWPAQLRAAQAENPVFAVVGGLAGGDWTPIDAFCEAERLPCLFPITDWPASEPGHFTLYLSRGLPGEATLIADRLAAQGVRRVTQVNADTDDATALARFFETTAAARGVSVATRSPGALTDADMNADAFVLWMAAGQVGALASGPLARFGGPVYVAGGLVADERDIVVPAPGRPVEAAWRFAPRDLDIPQRRRVRGWLAARRVRAPDFERTQLDAYLALDALDHALVSMVDRYSRDFLIESIEHMIEGGLNTGAYPRLSLGPGQRFAAQAMGFETLRAPEAACPPGAARPPAERCKASPRQ